MRITCGSCAKYSSSRPGPEDRPGGIGTARSRSLLSGLLLCLSLLLTVGCSNRCQNLCESWYQLELKCEQLGLSSGMQPASCLRGEADPQLGQQRSDFSNRQCRQDFREATCTELKQCCSVVCVDGLREEWASVVGTEEKDYDRKRDICQRFRQLGKSGSALWCDRLQSSCQQASEADCATTSTP